MAIIIKKTQLWLPTERERDDRGGEYSGRREASGGVKVG